MANTEHYFFNTNLLDHISNSFVKTSFMQLHEAHFTVVLAVRQNNFIVGLH